MGGFRLLKEPSLLGLHFLHPLCPPLPPPRGPLLDLEDTLPFERKLDEGNDQNETKRTG